MSRYRIFIRELHCNLQILSKNELNEILKIILYIDLKKSS